MREQGTEPYPEDCLIWIIPTANYWNEEENKPASNYYKKPMFSMFLESEFDSAMALDHARGLWGDKSYGVIRVRYQDLLECGYRAVFEVEGGVTAHVNVSPDPSSSFGKGKKAAMIREKSEVVVKFGSSVCDGDVVQT